MKDQERHEAEEVRSEERAQRKVKVTDKRHSKSDAASPDAMAEDPTMAEASAGGATVERPEAASTEVDTRGTGAPKAGADANQRAELDQAKAEAAEYLDHLKRLKAEFDNYRKRVLKEQTRAVELATEPVMSRLLEVLDEFELAVMAAERKPEFERFLHGVEMVYAKLKEILRAEGLEAIGAKGEPFDPEVHEALLQSEEPGEGEPYVSDVLRTGYRLKGRVLRPAGVKVARR